MTLFLNCQDLSKSHGSRILFQNLSFGVFAKDRIGLIGPNGSGKSTLLHMLIGKENPTSGTIALKRDLKLGYVPQECVFEDKTPTAILLGELFSVDIPEYEKELLVEIWLSKMGFDGKEVSAKKLSGGWKKRLKLAQALIQNPDLLLLDEPTNHLDLEGILFLEKLLLKEVSSFVLVSHDRYFLQNMVSKVIEINPLYPKGLFGVEGSYENFLEKKTSFIKGQIEEERSLASKARRELDWLRRGPKARMAKAVARIDKAHEVLKEHAEVKIRNTQKRAKIDFVGSARETQKLLSVKNLSKSIQGRLLFQNLDFVLSPGSCLGLVGPNGSGKTTLLKILAEELAPDQGTLKKAEGLQVVYFDQHRLKLPLSMTLREALCPKGEFVSFRGQMIHVNGWCQRFLFAKEWLDMPLSSLSGGERARISIAYLMLQPADLLLLDEPTNDLDIATLETLEESLLDFPGAVVLITHDRCMLDRVCHTILSLETPGLNEVYAEYAQWEAASRLKEKPPQEKKNTPLLETRPKQKLTYGEKKEYQEMETKILQLEEELQRLNRLLLDPSLAKDPKQLQDNCSQIGLLEIQIEKLYIRWEELEKRRRNDL